MSDAGVLAGRLEDYIRGIHGDICTAFSGGVDSSVVAKAAKNALASDGRRAVAVTFVTPLQSREDTEIARRVAGEIGTIQVELALDPLTVPNVRQNSRERCYFCKKFMFTSLWEFCREKGFSAALDGTNADDTGHYRPGLRAVEELGVISPLKELGYTKRDIVAVAEFYGLTVAGRPASPCMATRIPYGEVLDREVLSRLCQGETMLKAILPGPLRLRLHGRVLRMEAPPDSFEDVIRNRERIIAALKALGFVYITLDIEGFRSGSMDL